MTESSGTFVVLVFPDIPENASKAQRLAAMASVAKPLMGALTTLSTRPPHLIHPNSGCIAVLTQAPSLERLQQALVKSLHNELRWFAAPCEPSIAAFGLDAASAWCTRAAARS